jgi:hypothetical protein
VQHLQRDPGPVLLERLPCRCRRQRPAGALPADGEAGAIVSWEQADTTSANPSTTTSDTAVILLIGHDLAMYAPWTR